MKLPQCEWKHHQHHAGRHLSATLRLDLPWAFSPAITPVNRLPSITFSGAPNTEWNVNYWPWRNSYLNYQLRDDVSWSKGNHQFKFGFGYMRNDKNQQQQADTQGDYTFSQSAYSGDAYANFLLGFASTLPAT